MKKLLPLAVLLLVLVGSLSACGGQDTKPSPSPEQPGQVTTPQTSREPETTPAPIPVHTNTPAQSPVPATTPPVVEPLVSPTEDPDLEPTTEPTAEPTGQPTAEPVVTETPAVQGPDDETVLEAYRMAEEAYAWFRIAPMSFDATDSREVNGVTYYRVDQPGMDSTASLRGYLKGLFSDDLVESLLPYGGTQYIDLDGALYVQDGGRGANIYRGCEFTQVVRGDDPNRLVVRVTVEVVDPEQDGAVTGSETYEFPYEKVGERWIFTDFSLVR